MIEKLKPFLFVILLIFSMTVSNAILSAYFFGDSGGIKNEGDYPVKIQLISQGNVYEWVILARGDSYDFGSDVEKVLFRHIESSSRVHTPKLKLFHSDGSSTNLIIENEEYTV